MRAILVLLAMCVYSYGQTFENAHFKRQEVDDTYYNCLQNAYAVRKSIVMDSCYNAGSDSDEVQENQDLLICLGNASYIPQNIPVEIERCRILAGFDK